jgi:putative heme transporter
VRSQAFVWFVRGIGLALGAGAALLLLGGLVLAWRALLLVFIALLLASGLQPVVDWARSRSRLGRGGTVLVVYAVFFVLIIGLALLVVPAAVSQFNSLGVRLTPLLNDARSWAMGIEPRGLSLSLTALIDAVAGSIPSEPAAPDPEQVIAFGITVADLAISVIGVLALVFFWLTERARLQRFALALVPADRRPAAREAWNEIELRLGQWVRGQLILMASIGAMTGTAYFLIGLEGALVLALIAALAEAIPLVGPALGAVPALFVAAATGQIETVLLVGLVYVAIQVFEGNVLVPIVMRNTIGVPPFLVVVSILIGAQIGGIVGALVAVPATAAGLVILERLQARRASVSLDPTALQADVLELDDVGRDEPELKAGDEPARGLQVGSSPPANPRK